MAESNETAVARHGEASLDKATSHSLLSELILIQAIVLGDDGKKYLVILERPKGALREGKAVAKDSNGHYFHVWFDGTQGCYRPLYKERYELAGQYRYGTAYVRKGYEWIVIDENGKHIGLFANTLR